MNWILELGQKTRNVRNPKGSNDYSIHRYCVCETAKLFDPLSNS